MRSGDGVVDGGTEDGGGIVAERATERTLVAAPPAECYAVVADVERYPTWVADVKAVQVEDRDDQGRPTTVVFRAAAFGRSTTYTLAYDYSGAPHELRWTQTAGDLTNMLDGSYRFEPADGGATEVAYELQVELKVPLPGFIKRRAQSRIMHNALAELKARVEASITA